jgi:hypothetical protein
MDADARLVSRKTDPPGITPRREFLVQHIGQLDDKRVIENAALEPAHDLQQLGPEFVWLSSRRDSQNIPPPGLSRRNFHRCIGPGRGDSL